MRKKIKCPACNATEELVDQAAPICHQSNLDHYKGVFMVCSNCKIAYQIDHDFSTILISEDDMRNLRLNNTNIYIQIRDMQNQ